ncbi:MAG: pitrilysin family protein [Rhodospirillaceae bacterium]|nr:pitrilysin family protein [Rhodospirillaceae bacterium]
MTEVLRRVKALLVAALVSFASTGAGPAAAAVAVFGAESFMLKNGMEVVVIPNHRAPVVTHMVWYRVGAIDEPPGKSGIAHFLEHLMFKGTPKYPAGAMNEVVARNGGDQNAFTSYDYTAYYQNIAVDRLPLMMEIEADRMRNLILSEEDVSTERDVIIEERRMRVSNRPEAILGERLDAAMWMTHRYGIPVLGWAEEMADLQRADALAFYKRFYSPENAILVVAGDMTAAKLKPLAEKHYGSIKRGGEPYQRKLAAPLPAPAAVQVTYRDPRVRQPRWSRQLVAPSFNAGERADVEPLLVFSEIAGGGATSKLYRALVVERKIAAGAGSFYNPNMFSYGTYSMWVTPNPGVEIAAAEQALDQELDKILADGGITDDDVAKAKQRMTTSLAYAKDSPFGAAQQVGMLRAIGIPLEVIESAEARLNAVTADQVRAAATRLFATGASGTAILLPAQVTQ